MSDIDKRLEESKEPCMKALRTLNYREGVVIGSYIGHLENKLKSEREEKEMWKSVKAGKLYRQNVEYRKALQFYADKENYEAWGEYENASGFFNNVDMDGGEKARSALGGDRE